MHTDPAKSRRFVEIKLEIFQAWKVMESGLGHRKLLQINQMVVTF